MFSTNKTGCCNFEYKIYSKVVFYTYMQDLYQNDRFIQVDFFCLFFFVSNSVIRKSTHFFCSDIASFHILYIFFCFFGHPEQQRNNGIFSSCCFLCEKGALNLLFLYTHLPYENKNWHLNFFAVIFTPTSEYIALFCNM